MTEADKQKLIAQFDEMAAFAGQISVPIAHGLRLGGLIQQLGATIQEIKPERPALAAVPEAS
jgi:hypothetical protein